MTSAFAALVILAALPRLHLNLYPVLATAGILAALWLSMRTARPCGLSPDRLWDAGVFAVAAAFVISRLLGAILFLVIEHGHLTLSFMDVLNFSSISCLSLLVTAVAVFAYLRWRKLPLLATLDAWSAPAALLWAALALADALTGTEPGMPTRVPWGVHTRGLPQGVGVHPVALYTALAALLLYVALTRLMLRRRRPGRIAAIALIAAGLLAFLLDMLHAPERLDAQTWLDTSQWVALAGIAAGAALLITQTRTETR